MTKTLATRFPLDSFDPGPGYPVITEKGTTITDDTEATAITAIAAAAGVTLRELTPGAGGGVPAPADGAALVYDKATGKTKFTDLNAAYAGRMDAASYTYNPDGTVATETVGGFTTTYAYNADGSVHTATRNGVTLTYSYNADGTVAGVA